MSRLRSNNVFGTITDSPLTNVATTVNSAGLANLAAVASPDYAVITLDPNRVNGAPEIIYVTAHTGAATSATIVRGQEGTAAREHPADTFWIHGATAVDFRPFNPPACRVYEVGGAQTLNHNTVTAITFDSERYDTDSMHSTSSATERITMNTAGIYIVGGNVSLTGETDYTSIVVFIRLNGTTSIGQWRRLGNGDGSADQPTFQVVTTYRFAANDYVELCVIQENTSANAETTVIAASHSPEFWATWVGEG